MNKRHPINHVKWLPRDILVPNDYNPNRQTELDMNTLITSIEADGWTQPIVVRPRLSSDDVDAGVDYIIVDGFHRWTAAGLMDCNEIPCVELAEPRDGWTASTIRHNRARGAHDVQSMAKLVQFAHSTEGKSKTQIAKEFGMDLTEVGRLLTSEKLFVGLMSSKDGAMEK